MLSEQEIRSLILESIGMSSKSTTPHRVVEEFGMCLGESRIDIAVINGSLIGYEIKSDFDNLKRLPSQFHNYSLIMDKLIVVTTHKHLEKVKSLVPVWCGLDVVVKKDNTVQLLTIRKPRKNLMTDPLSLVQLLWRDELIEALEKSGRATNFKNQNKHGLYKTMLETFTSKSLKKIVRDFLFSRSTWRVDQSHA